MSDRETASVAEREPDRRSWLSRLLRRPAPPVRRTPPAPATREQVIAEYTAVAQSLVDADPDLPMTTMFVCGVGPMTIVVDDGGDGRVRLEPRASMS